MTDSVPTAASISVQEAELTEDPISIQMDKRVDLIISILIAAAGIYIIYLASKFRLGSFPDPVGTRGLSYFTGSFIFFVGAFNAVRRLLSWSTLPGNLVVSEGKDDDAGIPAWTARPFIIVALAFAWAFLLDTLGFLLLTPPMLFAMMWLMKVRSWPKLIAFPLIYSFGMWAVFSQFLNVVLPLGPLTPLARSLGLMY